MSLDHGSAHVDPTMMSQPFRAFTSQSYTTQAAKPRRSMSKPPLLKRDVAGAVLFAILYYGMLLGIIAFVAWGLQN